MGCYKLTYDYEPTLFLESDAEKSYSVDLKVWSNPDTTFGGAGAIVLTSAGATQLTQGDGTYSASDIKAAAAYALKFILDNRATYPASLSWCNVGVGKWFEKLTGSSALLGMTTHGQQAYMKTSSDFRTVGEKNDIVDLANQGYLVIGVLNKSDGSGHIVGVMPGQGACYGGNWGYTVPMVLDTGRTHMWANSSAAQSWTSSDARNVSWYVYVPN
jgi:hypothetical protein